MEDSDKSDIIPLKQEEYKAFISIIEQGQVGHWVEIARALNVDQDTITAWKRLPEAQRAIETGISNALKKMEESGAKDWRMWETKLKMLGINPASKVDIKTDRPDPTMILLEKFGLIDHTETGEGNDAGKTENTSGETS